MNKLMNYKWIYFAISILVMLPGIWALLTGGLKLGIDFTGGTLLEYRMRDDANINEVRTIFESKGVEVSSIVSSGDKTLLIKTKPQDTEKINEVKTNLEEKYSQVDELRVENVGPTIGGETTINAFKALALSSIMIVIYLAIAFRKMPKPASSWRFGIAAILALLHDVIVVLGIFALLGKYLGIELDVLIVTALLTIIGFSVHDTIVVFDRIRENLPKNLSKKFTDVANLSIMQTLGRSLSTSFTVMLVLLAMLLFGGDTIRWFIVALLVGIISGTYSSIFNATALLCLWEEKLGH